MIDVKKDFKIKLSEELAYWVGVVQSDGSFSQRRRKDRKEPGYVISLGVGKRSLPMLYKFKKLCKTLFNRDSKIYKRRNREAWDFKINVKRLLPFLKDLKIQFNDPPKPPYWCASSPELFGSYLAGLIDGDGSVRIKRKKYPQCMIKIISGKSQHELANLIRKFLNCAVMITQYEEDRILDGRIIHGKWYELEFLVSSKNYEFVKKHVLPNLIITHKKEKIEKYISEKYKK